MSSSFHTLLDPPSPAVAGAVEWLFTSLDPCMHYVSTRGWSPVMLSAVQRGGELLLAQRSYHLRIYILFSQSQAFSVAFDGDVTSYTLRQGMRF